MVLSPTLFTWQLLCVSCGSLLLLAGWYQPSLMGGLLWGALLFALAYLLERRARRPAIAWRLALFKALALLAALPLCVAVLRACVS